MRQRIWYHPSYFGVQYPQSLPASTGPSFDLAQAFSFLGAFKGNEGPIKPEYIEVVLFMSQKRVLRLDM